MELIEQVNTICNSYQEDSKDFAAKPSLQALLGYLDNVHDQVRPTLMRNLLHIEVDRLRKCGQDVRVDDFLEAIPSAYAPVVRDVLLTSSMMSAGVGQDQETVTASFPTAIRQLGDFQILRQLGAGGMGAVFLAQDIRRGNQVALKTLPVLEGDRLHHFKREFRALESISHPNLITLHALNADGAQWFITMEVIHGTDFLSYVRPKGQLDVERLSSCVVQLVRGVMALHQHNIVHRDLKPSNVMVNFDGKLSILDFGLVLDASATASGKEAAAGTPAYMSPEQAALVTRSSDETIDPVTGASDWYTVGLMLYEAIVGKLPFSGRRGLLDRQTEDVAPIDECDRAVTPLAKLAHQLLSRKVADRPDPQQILQSLSLNERNLQMVGGVQESHPLVGRDGQLAELHNALELVRQERSPTTVFIEGRSGEGKTSLLNAFLEDVSGKNVLIMGGRCYDRESVPFKALDTLIDSLCSYLRNLEEVDAALLLPDDIEFLTQIFPVLTRVPVVRRAVTRDHFEDFTGDEIRTRAFLALREIFGRLSRHSPLICFVDDLQWGDRDSASSLLDVLQPPNAGTVLFIGTYRSDETDDSEFLNGWKEQIHQRGIQLNSRTIGVGPLGEEQCVDLAVMMLGSDTQQIRGKAVEFARDTKGNPFLFIDLLGCYDPESNTFHSLQTNEVIDLKMQELPQPTGRNLLEVIAVASQAARLDEVLDTIGTEDETATSIRRMCKQRLLRLLGNENEQQIDTYHDRIRESVLANLPANRKRNWHERLANRIEQDIGCSFDEVTAFLDGQHVSSKPILDRVYDLSFHFDRCGNAEKARSYAILAAESARKQKASEVAVQQYAIASSHLSNAPELRFRVAEGYAEVATLVGAYDIAEQQIDIALQNSTSELERGSALIYQSKLLRQQSQLSKSAKCAEEAVRLLGKRVPRSKIGFGVALVQEVMFQFLRLRGLSRNKPDLDVRSSLVIDGLNCLFKVYWFQNSIAVFWTHFAGMNYGEKFQTSNSLAFTYTFHFPVSSCAGLFKRGGDYNNRGLEHFKKNDDQYGQGTAYFARGLGLYAAGKYSDAIAVLEQAIALLSKTGDKMTLTIAEFHLGLSYEKIGQVEKAVSIAASTFEYGARVGDNALCHYEIDAIAKCTLGNFPFDKLRMLFGELTDDFQSLNELNKAEGVWHLFHGRTSEAVSKLDLAFSISRRSVTYNWLTIDAVPWLITALRRHAESPSVDSSERNKLLKRAFRLAYRSSYVFRWFPNCHCHVLREYALLLALKGNKKKALKIIEKSIASAQSRDEQLELAQSNQVRAQIRVDLGISGARAELDAANFEVEEFHQRIAAKVREIPLFQVS